MKRKKWTEAEEETLLTSYAELISSCALISQMLTREKKFQPIADRINNLHHLHDPATFPFLWTWKDISTKIQNMRHQYLNTKLKLPPRSSTTNNSDWDHALRLWPNFLRYKAVFGDVDASQSRPSSSGASESASSASEDDKVAILERPASENASAASEDDKVANLEREMRRREGEERRERWRRREEEEMEWREKMVGMQMEHEKRVLQMHEEACQAQTQMIGVVVRLVCQFFGTSAGGGGGDGGINGLHNLQQQQQEEEESAGGSLVGDDVKNGVNSGEDYL